MTAMSTVRVPFSLASMTLMVPFYHRRSLIKQYAPYIPIAKARGFTAFFGKPCNKRGVTVRAAGGQSRDGR